jgi:hypothetical protein
MSAFSPYGSSSGRPPAELSNNPFIDHPANALSRYPDINGADQATGGGQQFISWLQPSSPGAMSPGGYTGSGQNNNPQYHTQQQSGWQGGGGYPPQGVQGGYGNGFGGQMQAQQTGRPFQPSSSFGQQLNGQLTAAGYPQQQQQQQQPSYAQQPQQYGAGYGYGQQPQQYGGIHQQQPNQPYLPEFDPLLGSGQRQGQNTVAQSTPMHAGGLGGGSQFQQLHPREFVQRNKTELEAWDGYAWKQVRFIEGLFILQDL